MRGGGTAGGHLPASGTGKNTHTHKKKYSIHVLTQPAESSHTVPSLFFFGLSVISAVLADHLSSQVVFAFARFFLLLFTPRSPHLFFFF